MQIGRVIALGPAQSDDDGLSRRNDHDPLFAVTLSGVGN
jgi:hypothetical protein